MRREREITLSNQHFDITGSLPSRVECRPANHRVFIEYHPGSQTSQKSFIVNYTSIYQVFLP
jgi:hypothetical protein